MTTLRSGLCGLALLACLGSGSAFAADITVTVTTADGKPVGNAVVSLVPASGAKPAAGSFKFPWAMVVAQKNIQFDPYILIVPVGADVSFPNQDKVRHHVYSFSPTKRFELKLYGQQSAPPTIKFDKAGTVALGCNIHDGMIGYIRVVDTPYAGRSAADGKVVLRDVPTGGGTLTVWQPDMRGSDNQLVKRVSGAAQETVVVDLRIRR
jgi:plastocyanin